MDIEFFEWILSCQIGFLVVIVESELPGWILSCQIGF